MVFSGDYREGETPLPIPNRAVKLLFADGTTTERLWESRSLPGFILKARLESDRLCYIVGLKEDCSTDILLNLLEL